MNKIRLVVGGMEYYINSSDDESYIQNIGNEVNSRLSKIREENPSVSMTMAAVLIALEYLDDCKKAELDAENLRIQMKGFIEDSATARLEADEARREIERLNKEIQVLRSRSNR